MRLDDIGFYTLTDERARGQTATSALWRCELLLTDRCNFRCPYCRGLADDLRGDLPVYEAERTIRLWAADGLRCIRFSGGEPTMYQALPYLANLAQQLGVQRVAVSTNGSAPRETYESLLAAGADDFSVSLDACCASVAERMAGCKCRFDRVIDNIRFLAARTYVTVGVVLNEGNVEATERVIRFADSLGVADIRIIPAAQYGATLRAFALPESLLGRHPILAYRINMAAKGVCVRGLRTGDARRCYLVRDDVAAAGGYHFPCIIYLRERGRPIGRVSPSMRAERAAWCEKHNPFADPICRDNCLDFCCEFNRAVDAL